MNCKLLPLGKRAWTLLLFGLGFLGFHANVSAQDCNGGMISTTDGLNTVYTCAGDSLPDVVNFLITGTSGTNFTYVITDADGIILGLPTQDSLDFEGAGAGVCLVWGLSYEGNLLAQVGDDATAIDLADGCFDLSDEVITVNRGTSLDGGMIYAEGELKEVYTCEGDGVDDVVNFVSTSASAGANFQLVITDENGVVLGLPPANSANFEGAGPGTCLAWGLYYTGDLTLAAGDDATAGGLASGCYALTETPVRVVRGTDLDGGMIYADGGLKEVYTCEGDGIDDVVNFVSSSPSQGTSNFQLVITDENGVVLGLPPANSANFEGAGPGTCLAWGLYYTGDLTLAAGDDATAGGLASGCYALTAEPVRVVRGSDLDGGMIYAEGGLKEVYTCEGDGIDDVVNFVSTSPSQGTSNFQLVITDENGVVLGLPPANSANFEGAGPGTCLAWGLYYTGDLTLAAGDVATAGGLASGCYALTAEPVRVVRGSDLDGGMIYAEGGLKEVYTCEGDGIDDVVNFVSTSPSQGTSNFQLVITDENGVVLGLPPANSANFEGAGPGTCLAWGLYYTGDLTLAAGDDATAGGLASGCYALTVEPVRIVRGSDLDGGMIYAEGGLKEVYTCEGDGIDDVVNFVSTSPSQGTSNFQLVITDENGVVLGLPPANSANFEGAGPGTCLAWGLYYTGDLTLAAGDDATAGGLASGCYALTEEPVRVVRGTDLDGGMIYADGELLQVYTCPGDGVDDVVSFNYSSSSLANFQLVITDEAGNILGLPPGNEANFEGAGEGVCLAWGLNYTGDLLAMVGENATQIDLASGCFALSDTFVTITRGMLDGGMIYAEGETLEVNTCPGDGNDDIIAFNYSSPNIANFQLVITDTAGNILGLPPGNEVNFEGAGEGVCLAWGLNYTGNLTTQVGDNALAIDLSDGCFALSESFVTINRSEENCSSVSIDDALSLGEINVFPNPVGTTLSVRLDASRELAPRSSIHIFDLQGRHVFSEEHTNSQNGLSVDLALPALRPGMYLLRVVNGERFVSKTFLKQ